MKNKQDDLLHTGYNDLKQVEMSIQSAQKIVGHATMSMDHTHLNHAREAIDSAKILLQEARNHSTGVDTEFLQQQQQLLHQCEEQINEAMDQNI